MSPLPINFTVSSRTLKSLIPFAHKKFEAMFVPKPESNKKHHKQQA